MPYLHDLPGWPSLAWNASPLTAPLAACRHRQGRLVGRMETLGLDLAGGVRLETLTRDAVKSSAIEGEVLEPLEVRSSIASRLGLDVGGQVRPPAAAGVKEVVEGVVEVTLDATENADAPVTTERLCGWQAALFPTGRSGLRPIAVGAFRPTSAGPMQVVSGPIGRQRIHFEAPAAERLADEVQRLVHWLTIPEPTTDPVLRAGLAHLWFLTIHPFEDGNGRVARALTDLLLTRMDGASSRFYSVSGQVEAERKSYFLELERAQRGGLDVTRWLGWFVGCVDRAVIAAEATVDAAVARARRWASIDGARIDLNGRQRRVLRRMMGDFEGHLTASKYAKLAKTSHDTALRDVKDLLAAGLLERNPGGGRSTSYRLADAPG